MSKIEKNLLHTFNQTAYGTNHLSLTVFIIIKLSFFVFASHLSDSVDMNSPNDEVGAMCVSEALWFDLSCSLYM